jgi:ferric-dicitrate binding protein FerR (iron transport regulator)
MEQKAFREILDRYLAGSCTPQEEALVEAWFEALKSEDPGMITGQQEKLLHDAYKRSFRRHFDKERSSATRHTLGLWMKLAASITIILIPVLYFYSRQDQRGTSLDVSDARGIEKIVNTQTSAYRALLSDGTVVVLNPGASLTFKPVFDAVTREVFLEGEAFFDVVHDASSPFIVTTAQLTARVLGTSFTIKANKEDGNFTVTVKTGKVSVQQVSGEVKSPAAPTVLTRNQQAVYNILEHRIERKELEDPGIIAKSAEVHRHRFNEAPVTEILRAIESSYQTKIVFDESNFKGCLLSTSFSLEEDLFKRLDIICKVIGAAYKVDDVSILISGKPCNETLTY